MTKKQLAKKPVEILIGRVKRYNFLGIIVALAMLCLSLTPSLLPRPWLMQGLISGFSMAIGYGIGVMLSAAIRWLTEAELPTKHKKRAWQGLFILAPIFYVAFILLGEYWQNDVRRLVGEQPQPGNHIINISVVAFLMFVALVFLSRAIRLYFAFLQRNIDRYLPWRWSVALAAVFGGVVLYWLVSGLLLSSVVSYARDFYSKRNDATVEGVEQPTSAARSGSQASLIAWDTLGRQGRSFAAGGPTQVQLEDFSGSTPMEPIRVYAGLKSAPTAAARAALVVKEMQRTGAFSRKVIVLATATGTGWLDPPCVDSVEYIWNGNTAFVSQQYSDLPSWISFLVDKENATEAGQALYNAVYAQWSLMPKDTRPKLVAFGLSLGSYGGQSAYSGPQDLALSIDGALFMGTPSETAMWRDITANRDAGSPEWQPIYQGGKIVRFAATNENIRSRTDGWRLPRILYMQHASDPVVWYNADLLFHRPDWLAEKRGYDVTTSMNWYPIVTFLQVTVDTFYGLSVPVGHGHNYENTIVAAWASLASPANWTQAKSDKLQAIIDAYKPH